jgi:hypothetical protein
MQRVLRLESYIRRIPIARHGDMVISIARREVAVRLRTVIIVGPIVRVAQSTKVTKVTKVVAVQKKK